MQGSVEFVVGTVTCVRLNVLEFTPVITGLGDAGLCRVVSQLLSSR